MCTHLSASMFDPIHFDRPQQQPGWGTGKGRGRSWGGGVRPVRLDSQSCLTARLTSAKPNYLFPSELHVCVCPPAWKRSSSHFFYVSFLWIFLAAFVYVFLISVQMVIGEGGESGNGWNGVRFCVVSQQAMQTFSIYFFFSLWSIRRNIYILHNTYTATVFKDVSYSTVWVLMHFSTM